MNAKTNMRAIAIKRFGNVDELQLMYLPIPAPRPGEVLIQVVASGINPVDVLLRKGFAASSHPQFPIIMGVDLSGIVESVGSGVSGLEPGEAVYS